MRSALTVADIRAVDVQDEHQPCGQTDIVGRRYRAEQRAAVLYQPQPGKWLLRWAMTSTPNEMFSHPLHFDFADGNGQELCRELSQLIGDRHQQPPPNLLFGLYPYEWEIVFREKWLLTVYLTLPNAGSTIYDKLTLPRAMWGRILADLTIFQQGEEPPLTLPVSYQLPDAERYCRRPTSSLPLSQLLVPRT